MENINNLTDSTNVDQPVNFQLIPPVKKNKKLPLIIVGVLLFVLATTAGAYYLGTKNTKSITENESSTENLTPTEAIKEIPLFSGQVKRLDQDLKLFKKTADGNSYLSAVYYSAGVFNKGDLKDYTRIIAIESPQQGPGDPSIYILATKDFQIFILNDPDSKTTKSAEDNWENPYSLLDKSKIVSTATFDTQQSKEIILDDNFSLYFDSFLTKNDITSKVDSLGNKISEDTLISDFSSYQKLTSPIDNLIFYFKPSQKSDYFDKFNPSQQKTELLKEKYIKTDTSIIVVDSTGLPMYYVLARPESIKKYQENMSKDSANRYLYLFPSLGFESSTIQNKDNLTFYKNYDFAIPAGCAIKFTTKVVNITDSELEQIGTVSNFPVYRLKDKTSSFYNLAFDNKMEYYDISSQEEWNSLNKGIKKPTLQEYIDNNPLIFIKDYWQRWVALGEYDIVLPGGCGKPVVYLYPTKPTEVSIKFNSPVQFTTDIPKYGDFWQVLAQPNGSLKNLKSNDCSQIDSTKKGSEYAAKACQTNNYPYLFWAGNIYSKEYPSIDKGWIVEKNDLSKFLETKLSEIGLNSQEKEDFISYWLPDMINKNTPYYRLSFLQTNELNSLFPMTITPNPDTIFRIFLDYLPLDKKPENSLLPQVLNKLTRQGFTMVEWGGLKRY